jgi:hypothetical protein
MTRPAIHHDPEGVFHGLPTWPWNGAPDGYATARQLRAAGLRPGGQPPAGQIVRGHRLWAALYRIDLAKPKRTASDAWYAATRKATRARHQCRGRCGRELEYIPAKRHGYQCNDCASPGRT